MPERGSRLALGLRVGPGTASSDSKTGSLPPRGLQVTQTWSHDPTRPLACREKRYLLLGAPLLETKTRRNRASFGQMNGERARTKWMWQNDGGKIDNK